MDQPEQDKGILSVSQKKPNMTGKQRRLILHLEQQQTIPF
jgi:hypothetical protein